MKRAFAIRHVAFEDLGSLAALLRQRGYDAVYLEAGIADLASIAVDRDDLLIVLGGPIGAYEEDRYPFLRDELRVIEQALRADVPILGLCLGAQLLARALGARVYAGKGKEIGVAPIELSAAGHASCLRHLAPDFRVLHWHGDTFDLPAGATCLASTSLTPHQAFSMGAKILGLQFHIEAEAEQAERWLIGHTCELTGASLDVPQLRQDMRRFLPEVAQKSRAAIGEWLDGAAR
ncbi:glutamine amidotransferase [Bradyrhizobium lablabi]|uniref:glutamine amidotransferase n=1 Tax=Bradyrhizobium lablabi TaxID=722472 RepID=UPI001BA7A81F|nr:glutamine amidotransferase [Bradyrhizobium lablabi]MBR1122255.1 glutamine amidotransferase [Bradyrhizobium lablabi]